MAVIVFDLDGTLVDSLADITNATNAALQHLGLSPVKPKQVHETIGYGLAHTLRSFLPSDMVEEKVLDGIERALAYYEEHPVSDSRVFEEVPEMLKELVAMHHELSILSNKNQTLVSAVVQYFFHDIPWRRIIGIDAAAHKKPNPHYAEQILAERRDGKEGSADAWMVGDATADALLARNAALGFIGAGWGYYSVSLTANDSLPFTVFSHPLELLSVFN